MWSAETSLLTKWGAGLTIFDGEFVFKSEPR
jgi:hypothetical protein